MLKQLLEQFGADRRHVSLVSACARSALTAWFALSERELFRAVAAEPAYRDHVAALPHRDVFGFASHRSYLVLGLSRRARGLLALQHYRNETAALDPSYYQAVYHRGGLRLWQLEHEGTAFELRLMPGNDVMNEGGLSITFFVNGEAVTVLSYSNVDPTLLGHPPAQVGPGWRAPALVPYVTRRQSSRSDFRRAFTQAFGRGTPGHLCIAALEGVALAQGGRRLLGVPADQHPACRAARARGYTGLETMYDQFWSSLSGEPGPLAWSIPLPLQPTPLDQLDSNNRKRANRLRGHQTAVRDAAFLAFRPHLVKPPPVTYEPASELESLPLARGSLQRA